MIENQMPDPGKTRDEAGATAVEYGLMVALIALVILAAVTAVAPALIPHFQDVADALL